MTAVLILAERDDTSVRKPTLELLTIARRIGEPVAVVCGPAEPALTETLAHYGATAVYACPASAFDDYLAGPKAEVLAEVARLTAPVAVLVTSGPEGKEIAARVAVSLDAGIVTDAVDVQPGPDGPVVTQSVLAGSWRVRSEVRRATAVVTVRPNAARPEPAAAPATPAIHTVTVDWSAAARGARVRSRNFKPKTGRPDLNDAAIVVTGGRGVGSAERFDVIGALADALGGAVGATRAVTDLAWLPHEMQIGQTGKTVAPQLYAAIGVSGAIQHVAGMQASRTIVAVNKDPKAPIFQYADFGVVGDLHTILPALIDEIAKRRG